LARAAPASRSDARFDRKRDQSYYEHFACPILSAVLLGLNILKSTSNMFSLPIYYIYICIGSPCDMPHFRYHLSFYCAS
jgi:hypothetical protein